MKIDAESIKIGIKRPGATREGPKNEKVAKMGSKDRSLGVPKGTKIS